MTTSDLVSVIIDDTNLDVFQYDALDTWDSSATVEAFNETSHTAAHTLVNRGNVLNYVQILFEGSALALVGNTPPPGAANAETFSVIIDNQSQAANSSYGDPDPPSYRQWYQSPIMAYGFHNITLVNLLGASIDYAVISHPNDATVLSGQTIIVDDEDPALSYEGQAWGTSSETYTSTPQDPKIVPYGNSTHATTSVGDHFEFAFPGGSEITIYGVLDFTRPGNLSLGFFLDNADEQRLDLVIPPGPFPIAQKANYAFYRAPQTLTRGDHTLMVTVLECSGNQTFTLDYITYVSPPDTASVVQAPTASSATHGTHALIGPIAGGVVGGVVFLLLVGLLFDCVRRRRRQTRPKFDYPFNHKVDLANPIPLESILSQKEGIRGGLDIERK